MTKETNMKKLIAIAAVALFGCTSNVALDLCNGDAYGYRTWAWYSRQEEQCADLEARAAYYGWGARTQYPTNECHRIEVVMYDCGTDVSQTNVLKVARYWIWGERR